MIQKVLLSSPLEDKTKFFKKTVLSWYKSNKREFNWRNTKDPWKILLIEVIAQQTQLERANQYYKKFIKAFPTPKHMASSKYIEVQKLWSGLGYNNRARRLFEASKIINEKGFNNLYPDFEILPGVGEYTKNALLSFAYGEKVLTKDTNINRIFERFFGTDLENYSINELQKILLKNISSRDLNQALMDLGSTICSSRHPQCSICPLEETCNKYIVKSKTLKVGKFKGSNREIRGQIVRYLIQNNNVDKKILKKDLKIDNNNLEIALRGLERDGLLRFSNNNVVSINSE